VDKHFPKSELEEYNYVSELIQDTKEKNLKLQERTINLLKQNKDLKETQDLRAALISIEKVDS